MLSVRPLERDFDDGDLHFDDAHVFLLGRTWACWGIVTAAIDQHHSKYSI